MRPTSIIKFIQKGKDSKYRTSPKEEKSKTMAMLMKLLETSKTANNLLGLFLKLCIRFRLLFFELIAFLRSVVESEKKATSEPEISAEDIKSKIMNTILKTIV